MPRLVDRDRARLLLADAEVGVEGRVDRAGHRVELDQRRVGLAAQVTPDPGFARPKELGRPTLAVDPTRPVMVDGGGATKAQTLPVHGDHYLVNVWGVGYRLAP